MSRTVRAVTRLRTLGVLLSGSVLLGACTGGPDPDAAPETPDVSLPGDEALVPAPPDPEADDWAERVADLPSGALSADVGLLLTGMAGFDEKVAGRCSPTDSPQLTFALADGSTVELTFADEGGELAVTAPGLVLEHVLRDVVLDADDGALSLRASLLRAGSSEVAGELTLAGSCR